MPRNTVSGTRTVILTTHTVVNAPDADVTYDRSRLMMGRKTGTTSRSRRWRRSHEKRWRKSHESPVYLYRRIFGGTDPRRPSRGGRDSAPDAALSTHTNKTAGHAVGTGRGDYPSQT